MDHVCIHGHFYQPPRENPWDEAVPRQPSAMPFHDWNARITSECYRPAGAARIRGPDGHVLAVVNTYARISFDIGPTLLRWLERHAPDVIDAMVAGDRAAVQAWGHGTALAQAYSHVILPLASNRDKRTQVRWALADFEARFGRRSEGIWLPECAVDTPTLEILAEEGVQFTILAPGQVEAVRPDGGDWQAEVDPRRPYRVDLPSGRSIAVFAYDGDIAQAVAFGRLLESGDDLYARLRHLARGGGLAHTATDGESYGHHHRHGEMALAWALHRLEREKDVRVVPYARYLADHPPTWQARIVEDSSWSCAHGIERWRSDCGCGTAPGGGHWRAPLRAALDSLAEGVDAVYEQVIRREGADPWRLRDAYVDVVLGADRSAWLREHLAGELDDARVQRVLTALEAQRQRLLMFASCGWFFDDLARIEPVQDLCHAWRAVELCARLSQDVDLGGPFLRALEHAHSNVASEGSGAELVRRRVLAVRMDLRQAAARHSLGLSSRAHRVQVGEFGIARTGWRVDRATVCERSTTCTAEVVRAWHPEAGLAGIAASATPIDELIQSLDASPDAWDRLTWRTGHSELPPMADDGPSEAMLQRCASLDPAGPRRAMALLDAVHDDLDEADRALAGACLVSLLADPRTHGLRWRGVRRLARERLGVEPDGVRDARTLPDFQMWCRTVRERLDRRRDG